MSLGNQEINGMSRYTQWKSWGDEKFGVVSETSKYYFSSIFAKFLKDHQQLNILEVGFGNGEFLGWCRQKGFSVSGIEADATLVDRATSDGFNVYTSLDEVPHGSLDAIFLFDVLEHIVQDEIESFLQVLSNLLKRDGKILLRVPNGGSPLGLANQYGDPTHLTVVTSTKLNFWAESAGLKIDYSGRDLFPIYDGRVKKIPGRLLKKILRNLVERLFRFIFSPQSSGCLSANLLSVLRKDCSE